MLDEVSGERRGRERDGACLLSVEWGVCLSTLHLQRPVCLRTQSFISL